MPDHTERLNNFITTLNFLFPLEFAGNLIQLDNGGI